MTKVLNSFFIFIVCCSFVVSQHHYQGLNSSHKFQAISGDDYYTDEAGNVFIYVNIIGHVKNPGTYLVPENLDFMSILSQAGGPLQGAKLSNTRIYHKESGITEVPLDTFFAKGEMLELKIKPNDTIYIQQSLSSYLFSNSNLINSLLQLMNIYLTITNR